MVWPFSLLDFHSTVISEILYLLRNENILRPSVCNYFVYTISDKISDKIVSLNRQYNVTVVIINKCFHNKFHLFCFNVALPDVT